jgi:CotS family spore coat protein
MDKPHLISLRELMQTWNYQAKRIEPIRDVYKVVTTQGIVALKGNLLPPEQMQFIHSFLRHLQANGFNQVLSAIPTPDGRDFIVMEGVVYSLYLWIDGKRPNFRHLDELNDACRTLAKMHHACNGFHPSAGSRPRKRWGRLIETHKKRRHDLAAFAEIANQKKYPSRFDREYLKNLPDYLNLADQSLASLNADEYNLAKCAIIVNVTVTAHL